LAEARGGRLSPAGPDSSSMRPLRSEMREWRTGLPKRVARRGTRRGFVTQVPRRHFFRVGGHEVEGAGGGGKMLLPDSPWYLEKIPTGRKAELSALEGEAERNARWEGCQGYGDQKSMEKTGSSSVPRGWGDKPPTAIHQDGKIVRKLARKPHEPRVVVEGRGGGEPHQADEKATWLPPARGPRTAVH